MTKVHFLRPKGHARDTTYKYINTMDVSYMRHYVFLYMYFYMFSSDIIPLENPFQAPQMHCHQLMAYLHLFSEKKKHHKDQYLRIVRSLWQQRHTTGNIYILLYFDNLGASTTFYDRRARGTETLNN